MNQLSSGNIRSKLNESSVCEITCKIIALKSNSNHENTLRRSKMLFTVYSRDVIYKLSLIYIVYIVKQILFVL